MGFLKRLFGRENEQQAMQKQMNALYSQFIKFVEY